MADKRKDRVTLALCLLVALALVGAVVYLWTEVELDREVVQGFRTPCGGNLVVLRDRAWEVAQGYYYKAWCRGELQADGFLEAYGSDRDLKFGLITPGNGSLVVLVEASSYHDILVIHDFASGESYTSYAGDPWGKREAMLERFRALTGEPRFKLAP